jgi:hypothetical protein
MSLLLVVELKKNTLPLSGTLSFEKQKKRQRSIFEENLFPNFSSI